MPEALQPFQSVGSIAAGYLFYGLYLSTFFHCIRWLVFSDEGWRVRKAINRSILAVTLAIWTLSTLNKALEIGDAMQMVTPIKPDASSTASSSVKPLPWGTVVVCSGANITTLLGDAVLIYRCWIIYEKSRRAIVFPVFFWLGGLMLTALQAYGQIVQSASLLKDWEPVNRSAGDPGSILTPFWLCTIVLNLYATFMIVRRIYVVSKQSKASTSVHRLQFTMRILIESGFLSLSTTIAHFIVWFTPNTYAISVLSGMNLSIEGIAYNLILIRVAQGRAEEIKYGNNQVQLSGLQFHVSESAQHTAQIASVFSALGPSSNTDMHDHTSSDQISSPSQAV